ncbi:MATE family efflux transporter [Micromonospora sp. NPDC002389]|uniref:MATE family efflux transporter n=1 Tax=Micromonospora sp. NPDC002389 TaxID=3154272 RepID=UPI00332BC874
MTEYRRQVLRQASPMVLGDLVGVLVPLVVVALMSRMGDDSLYIRSLFTPIMFVIIALHAGLAVPNQVASALSGDDAESRIRALAGFARIGAVASVVVLLLLGLAAPGMARLFGVDAGAQSDFVWFVRWVCLAALLGLGSVLCGATLRGAGRPREGAAVLLAAAAVEIVGVAALGLPGGLGLGLWSVPIAIAASGVVGSALGGYLLWRTGVWRPGTSLAWRPDLLGLLAGVGLPVFASYVAIFASNFALTWVVSAFGATVVSGFAVAYVVQSVVIVAGVAIGAATAIVANQYRGAGESHRMPGVLRAGLQVTAAFYVVCAVVVWTGRDWLARVTAADPAVAAEASRYLGIVAPTFVLMGLVLAALTVLEQVGGGPLAIALNVVYFGGIVAVGGYLARSAGGPEPLYWTIAIANLFGIAAVFATVLFVRRRAGTAPPETTEHDQEEQEAAAWRE